MEILKVPLRRGDIRPDWSEYFLNISEAISKRSTCPRLSVGCCITYNNRIISTGYNGAPSKMFDCIENGCIIFENHCTRVLHAEQNAVAHMGIYSINKKLKGVEAFITHKPCIICVNLLESNNVERCYYRNEYP